MNLRNLSRRKLAGAAVLGATLAWAGLASAHYGQRELRGHLTTQLVECDSMCTGGPLTGDLRGTLHWRLDSMDQTPTPNVTRYNGVDTITTPYGTFSGPDYGVWNTSTGQFTDYLEITSGTGMFAGAKGTLTIVGKFDPVTGTGSSEWRVVFEPR
ncbi:MAG TPA: hypothetical protein VFK05_19680 [Polyangiaceae bacterium]|nr:hypothetical protein [Polyangiaceae bacterium]